MQRDEPGTAKKACHWQFEFHGPGQKVPFWGRDLTFYLPEFFGRTVAEACG